MTTSLAAPRPTFSVSGYFTPITGTWPSELVNEDGTIYLTSTNFKGGYALPYNSDHVFPMFTVHLNVAGLQSDQSISTTLLCNQNGAPVQEYVPVSRDYKRTYYGNLWTLKYQDVGQATMGIYNGDSFVFPSGTTDRTLHIYKLGSPVERTKPFDCVGQVLVMGPGKAGYMHEILDVPVTQRFTLPPNGKAPGEGL